MDASTGRAKLGVFPKMSLTWAKVWLSLLNLWCHGLFSGQLSKGLSPTLHPVTQGSCTKIRIPWKITYPLWVQTATCSWEHPQLDPTFHFTLYPIIPELGLRVVVRVRLYAVNVYSWGKARIPRRWKCLEKAWGRGQENPHRFDPGQRTKPQTLVLLSGQHLAMGSVYSSVKRSS